MPRYYGMRGSAHDATPACRWPVSGREGLRGCRDGDGRAAPRDEGRVQPVRGDLRPGVHPRRRPGHVGAGRRGRPALARTHLPQGGRAPGRARGPGPAAPSGAPHRRPVAGGVLGRGARPGGDEPRSGRQRARPRRAGDLPRQPQRAQPRLDDARHRDGEVVPHPQQVQRHVGRPAARAAARLPDARPPAAAARPRHRPDRPVPGLRGEPDGLQRVADDGARLPDPAA